MKKEVVKNINTLSQDDISRLGTMIMNRVHFLKFKAKFDAHEEVEELERIYSKLAEMYEPDYE